MRFLFLSGSFVKILTGLQGVLLGGWFGPAPVGHNHAVWTVGCADTAAISGKELVAWLEVPSVGIVTVEARLITAWAKAVAVWHHACLLTIFLHKFE